MELDRINDIVKLNVQVMLNVTHRFINHSIKNTNNLIVFMSSCTSIGPRYGLSMYSSTKAFIKQFGKSVAREYKHIDCTTFVPWHISTEMIGNLPTNIGVCTPEEFVDSAFVHVGLTPAIDPYIPHYLQDWSYDRVPDVVKAHFAKIEYMSFEEGKEKKMN